jgi:ankyrin repeat protein
MPKFLPKCPDVEQLRRQAKELHQAAAAHDRTALARVREVSDQITLAAAQTALAREYGFASWARLKSEVQRKRLIFTGDVAGLARLLAEDPALAREQVSSCYQPDPDGQDTVLNYVAIAGFHGVTGHDRAGEITRVLLAAGAHPDDAPGAQDTPLIAAASYGETDMVRVLIEAGANLEAIGHGMPEGVGTALAHAVAYGNTDVIDVLVAAGALVHDIVDAAGAGDLGAFLTAETPGADRARALRAAAVCERLAVVDHLLDSGVTVDADLGAGRTVLHDAAWFGKPAAVAHLLARGADPGRRDRQYGSTPLGWCRHRRQELAGYGEHQVIGHNKVEAILAPITPE